MCINCHQCDYRLRGCFENKHCFCWFKEHLQETPILMCLKRRIPSIHGHSNTKHCKNHEWIDSGFRYLQGFPNMFRYQTHISWHKHEQTMTLRQQKVPQFVRKARPGLINVIHLGGLPAVNCGCLNSPWGGTPKP